MTINFENTSKIWFTGIIIPMNTTGTNQASRRRTAMVRKGACLMKLKKEPEPEPKLPEPDPDPEPDEGDPIPLPRPQMPGPDVGGSPSLEPSFGM
jgi:hypothetical protein